MNKSRAVLLLAYGSPDNIGDVEAYFTHIRGGRVPNPESVRELGERYEAIGGRTPLLRTTMDVAAGLEKELGRAGHPSPVYVGMKHWHPYIAETVEKMLSDGVNDVVAVALAPHYSKLSIGKYRDAVDAAIEGRDLQLTFVDHWYERAEFVSLIARRIEEALQGFSEADPHRIAVVFSAHSLPERIRTWNDPYESQLLQSCQMIAEHAGLVRWHFAWQSAGRTGEPWLGPDLNAVIAQLAGEGVENILSVPVGFVSDHLEVLYDIDIEARNVASELGVRLIRTPMPNASQDFVQLLAGIALDARQVTGILSET